MFVLIFSYKWLATDSRVLSILQHTPVALEEKVTAAFFSNAIHVHGDKLKHNLLFLRYLSLPTTRLLRI